MKTVAMMISLLNMDHSKPTWKVSWISRWNLLLVTFCLLDLSNGSVTHEMIKTSECPQQNTGQCPDGWFLMKDKKCIKLFKEAKTYSDASESCSNHKGRLMDEEIDDVTNVCLLEHLRDNLGPAKYIWVYYLDILNVETKEIEAEFDTDVRLPYACKLLDSGPPAVLQFVVPFAYRIGKKAEIKCITEGYPWPEIAFYRNDTGELLAYTDAHKSQQLVYTIEKLKCSDMGQYDCVVAKGSGWPQRKPIDFLMYKCPPRLCPGEDKTKTISAAIGETKTVSICVISADTIRIKLNETMIYYHKKTKKFDVDFDRPELSNTYYAVNVTIKNITQRDYGTVRMQILGWSGQETEFQLAIQPKENPVEDEIVDFVGEEIVDAAEEEIPVDVSESPVDYVGGNLDMSETLQTESKCQKIKELLTTAKKLLESALEIEFCNKPHSSRHDAYTDQTHENGGVMDEIH